MKKTLCVFMALLMIVLIAFSAPLTVSAAAPTQTEAYNAMISLKAKYPEGTPWGGEKKYYWNGGIYDYGGGCVAFAFMLSDAAFGNLPARMIMDVKFSEVRAGDILRMDNDTHSAIVLRVFEDYVEIAEGSYNNSVHWGRILTVDDVENCDHMLTRYPDGPSDVDPNPPQVPTENVLAKGNCGDRGLPNVKWVLSNTGEMYIYGTGKMDTYTNRTPWTDFASKITSVTFSGEVTYISPYGFRSLPNLKSVTVCNSVETIGVNAFANCTALNSVVLGNGLKAIESRAFLGCTALTSIVLPSSLQTLNIYAFAQSGLKKIALPDGLTYLGNNAFEECDSLVHAYIPGTVGNNFQYVFYACDNLSSVIFGPGLAEIGRYSFADCPALKSVSFPSTMKEIGDNAFRGSGLLSVELPEGITSLCERAFSSCEDLKSLSIPSTITNFESNVFAYCSALEDVKIADGLTKLGYCAFQYSKSLKSITLPESITEIPLYAFENSGLESISIPEGVTAIGKSAFANCSKLAWVAFPSTLKSIQSLAFDRCDSLWNATYYGTQSDWAKITIDSSNFQLNSVWIQYVDPNACRHTETVIIAAIEPSCQEPGWTAGKKCANPECGEIVQEPEYIPSLEHDWKAATCTTAKTCQTCGQTQGASNGHNWKAATCTQSKICRTCGKTEGNPKGHDWKAATCITPQICRNCSEVQGQANGHNWKAATCTDPKICKTCSVTEGKPNGHTSDGVNDCGKESKCTVCKEVIRAKGEHAWAVKQVLSSADCTNTGKAIYYCLGCQYTSERETPAIGHTWQAATCTTAKTCTVCSQTEGEPLGHDWKDATCQSAKLCLTCLVTEGTVLEHTDANDDNACDLCGETLVDNATGDPTEPTQTPDQPEATDPDPTEESVVTEPADTQPSEPTDATESETKPSTPEHTPPVENNTLVIVLVIVGVIVVAGAVALLLILRKKRKA